MKKRILSMLVMLTMVFSLIVVPGTSATAATFYDTADTDCELAADVLSALGIMGGYTDGTFLPNSTITKAEMAAIAVKMSGHEEYLSSVPSDMEVFNDMVDYGENWTANMVAIAKTAGIARSDETGNFYPDMAATYEDAVQMVVSALGYGHQAQSRGGSLLDYVYVAQRLGLTKKLATSIGNNITRGDVAKLVYAALTVDVMEAVTYSTNGTIVTYEAVEGVNVLNKYFNVYEVSGIINQTEFAAIDGESTLDEEQVLINGEAFDIGSTDIYNYLGYYATVYALDDEENVNGRTIIAYSVKSVKNNTITLIDDSIEDVTYKATEGYTFEYWANKTTDSKTKKFKTSATPLVLYNGKSIVEVTEKLLMPQNGHVVLIDNNGDDKYDIIDVWEYELIHVFTASQASGNVSGYYDRSTTYKLDPNSEDYRVTFLNANGGVAKLSDIKQHSVLYLYESIDKKEKRVVISNGRVNGSISEISSEGYYTINGIEYELSPAVANRLEFAVTDTGDFYLDADNRIAGFDGTTVIRHNIGMFIAANDGGLRRGYQFKILTAYNGVQILNLASSVKVNDVVMSPEEIYKNVYTDALFGKQTEDSNLGDMLRPNPSRSMFLYKVNSRNQITEMIVVGEGEEGDGYLQRRKIRTLPEWVNDQKCTIYYSAAYKCIHFSLETVQYEGYTVGMRTYCDDKTINFLVEEARRNTDDNKSFYTKPMTSYWDNANFEVYDFCWAYYYSPDKSPVDMQKTVASFIVMANWYDNSVDSDEDTEQSEDADKYQPNTVPKYIHKITEAYDKTAGETTYRVYYYDGTSLRNNLIRPKYKREAFIGDRILETGPDYLEGYPVRIAMDGSYIEDIAPFFGTSVGGWPIELLVTPVYNASTDSYVTPFMPFYQRQTRKWNSWGADYTTDFYCGVITSIDEVVGRKIFTLAAADGSLVKLLPNEKLEGPVTKLHFDRDGHISSITNASLDDIAPGQLVLVKKYYYDSSPKWYSLTGAETQFVIISEDASELDYLSSFYQVVYDEIMTANKS